MLLIAFDIQVITGTRLSMGRRAGRSANVVSGARTAMLRLARPSSTRCHAADNINANWGANVQTGLLT